MAPRTELLRKRADRRSTPSGRPASRGQRGGFDDLQRDIGNQAVGKLIQAEKDGKHAGKATPIYETAAARSTGLPEDLVTLWAKQAKTDPEVALAAVVKEMCHRGELDKHFLQTQGEGKLWNIVGGGGDVVVSFRAAFADPDDASRKLPNPRFAIPRDLFNGSASGLKVLHMSLLHEFRHVRQQSERINLAEPSATSQEPGYCNDPDEFDAYLSEVEAAYDAPTMYKAAIQAGVNWEALNELQRRPFVVRWQNARKRIKEVLGVEIDVLLKTNVADTYRKVCQEKAAAAGAASGR